MFRPVSLRQVGINRDEGRRPPHQQHQGVLRTCLLCPLGQLARRLQALPAVDLRACGSFLATLGAALARPEGLSRGKLGVERVLHL